jgi:acyl-CoA reductase-like NAD-dependent aldehyde dehydrogenase
MSEARNADVQMPAKTVISGTSQRADVLERGLLIGGSSVPASSGKLADDISPWDGEVYARVAAGTPADITRAADAAEAAFPSWSKVGAFERREIFLRAADVMAKRREEAIAALARETGASLVFSEYNVFFCIQVLREAAAAITRPVGELLPTSIPGAYSIAQRIPVGVVGAISPWNAPLVLGIRSIAIPLAVGNTAGDPADPATIVGPLINTRGAQRVSKLVKDAAAKGASLLTGDGAIEGPNGTLIRPVVLTDVTTDMDIFASEIFGPATVIHPVDSTEAAIDMANDTEYGLTGGVISRDLKFGGTAGIESFTEQHWVTIQHSGRPTYPF